MKPSIELIRLIAVILITFTHTRNNLEDGLGYFIIECLPLYGTAILSIISGYLYYEVSRKKEHLFARKIKSLAIPYLIANVIVVLLVVLLNEVFGYNALNRLNFDISIILDGIFSLNAPPINPPTYFIRDIFIIFSIIALFTQKEYKALLVLIPFVAFGTLVLRLDVAFLFALGVLFAKFKSVIPKIWLLSTAFLSTIAIGIFYPEYLKFPISVLLFVAVVDLQFQFPATGRYSYLLHLYHSPIIVASYPIISLFIKNTYLNLICQITMAILTSYIFHLLLHKYKSLRIVTGGR